MPTWIIVGAMLLTLFGVLYTWEWWKKKKANRDASSTVQMQAMVLRPLPWVPMVVAAGVVIAVWALLVTEAFDPSVPAFPRQAKRQRIEPAFPDASVPLKKLRRMKLVVFDDPETLNPYVMTACPDDLVTIVDKQGKVTCEQRTVLHELDTTHSFDAGVKKQAMLQAGKSEAPKARKRWIDKFAEIVFFFGVVFGVLGKYYWDYIEEKERGRHVEFRVNRIILSLIIAVLVYFGIQQGIEGEGGKFSTRGLTFAFTNGFMWQHLVKPGGPMAKLTNGKKENGE